MEEINMTDDSKMNQIKSEDTRINIKVANSDGMNLVFKVKRDTILKNVMDAFIEQAKLDKNAVVFLTDEGERIQEYLTPKHFNMEEGAVIEVHGRQDGGCQFE